MRTGNTTMQTATFSFIYSAYKLYRIAKLPLSFFILLLYKSNKVHVLTTRLHMIPDQIFSFSLYFLLFSLQYYSDSLKSYFEAEHEPVSITMTCTVILVATMGRPSVVDICVTNDILATATGPSSYSWSIQISCCKLTVLSSCCFPSRESEKQDLKQSMSSSHDRLRTSTIQS
jgi:hypothetical protein